MKDRPGDKARLQHIYDAILEIESYTENSDIDEFLNNSMMRFACIKQIEIIGEAGNHISEEFRGKFKEIEWRKIVGLRNILVHEYFGV
ncbi:HepT-like ribonuclease domain-containing protein [Runella sp.]|uniref:HepT-like ribonuclease domain-containing protein n=1 Tax=Runella sp. TaxID=1960881 RepID=UPI003D13A672